MVQPPGDGGIGSDGGFRVAAEALDVGAADAEQGRELAHVQGVGLTGQAGVAGQEPG
jgi:hypothetical protein